MSIIVPADGMDTKSGVQGKTGRHRLNVATRALQATGANLRIGFQASIGYRFESRDGSIVYAANLKASEASAFLTGWASSLRGTQE